ncbi:hypothetical protein CYY_003109 [Polysphondylium violaceum]|uniref:Condensation domain-containing protein n=1 Tax=Polysphondylium violaceum TaxID=133409 RepID=A0A8J4PZ31_9MYCE|nr:hypothetical protein CYY_003109 [Polysphondylium violaceum]
MDKIGRELGLTERYQISKQLTNIYGTLGLTANIKLRDSSNLSNNDNENIYLKSYIYPAISLICSTIPQLSVSVIDLDTTAPKFLQLHSLDLERIVSFQTCKNRDTLADLIKQEIGNNFDITDKSVPMWRLKVICFEDLATVDQQGEISIIFSMDHVIADGMSTTILMKELVNAINAVEPIIVQEGWSCVNVNVDQLVWSGPLDQRTPHHPGLWELLPVVIKHVLMPPFLQKYIYGTPKFWAGEKRAVQEKHCTHVQLFEFDQLPQLLAKCRANATTPHAAIYVAIVMATLQVYGDNLQLIGATPYSIRNLCELAVSDTEVGNFVSGYDRTKDYQYSHLSVASNFWLECRQYKQEIVDYRVTGVKYTNMLKHVGPFPNKWTEFWLKRLESLPFGRNCSFEFSDLGNVDFSSNNAESSDDQSPFQLKSVLFAQSANIVGSVFNINTITTNQILKGSITYQKESITDENATLIINNLKTILTNIIVE